MRRQYFGIIKKDPGDITDAVGEVIRKERRRRMIRWQAKIVGWLIVVLVAISLVLLSTNIAH